MTIRCEIVSQDRTVFQGDVDIVLLPGMAGEMGILPDHAPLLTLLKYGVIKIRKQGTERLFAVSGGMAEVQPDIVTILADAAENIEEIDVIRAQPPKNARKMPSQRFHPKNSRTPTSTWKPRFAVPTLRLDVVRRYRKVRDTYTEQDSSM
jgi:F-type H+-transporting ATPase subunit epsilon